MKNILKKLDSKLFLLVLCTFFSLAAHAQFDEGGGDGDSIDILDVVNDASDDTPDDPDAVTDLFPGWTDAQVDAYLDSIGNELDTVTVTADSSSSTDYSYLDFLLTDAGIDPPYVNPNDSNDSNDPNDPNDSNDNSDTIKTLSDFIGNLNLANSTKELIAALTHVNSGSIEVLKDTLGKGLGVAAVGLAAIAYINDPSTANLISVVVNVSVAATAGPIGGYAMAIADSSGVSTAVENDLATLIDSTAGQSVGNEVESYIKDVVLSLIE